jgi:alkyl sulfatase BDS1-like metallo-beta-lactamase superfamily hydrolase
MAYTSSQVVQAVPTGINSALVFIDSTDVTGCTSDVNNFQMQITAPQLAQQTFFTASWQSLYLTGTSRMRNGYHQSTTQFTDFVLLVRSGASDFTQGNIKIYGYTNS